LIITVDIDGVIADFVGTFKKVVKKRYGVSLKEREIRVHDLFQVLGIPEEEAYQLILTTLRQDLGLIPGARIALNKLKASGHTIVIVTSRPVKVAATTRRWLHLHGIPYDRLMFQSEGQKHNSRRVADVVVEDHLREAIRWMPKANRVLIFDHPWNHSLNVKHRLIRVSNWNEAVLALKGVRKSVRPRSSKLTRNRVTP